MGYIPPQLNINNVDTDTTDIYTVNLKKAITLNTNADPIMVIRGGQTEVATGSLKIYGAQTGNFPYVYLGQDKTVLASLTNTDVEILPQGTGVVKFGTMTADAAVTQLGYITIKDSGGTTRYLSCITP